MLRFEKLFTLLILGLFFSCQSPNDSIKKDKLALPEKPNILWLVTEDMGPYLPSFGDSTIQTPNLSRLAAEGVLFTNVYSPSGVCAPSRASIATGMYPSSIGASNMRTTSYTDVTGSASCCEWVAIIVQIIRKMTTNFRPR